MIKYNLTCKSCKHSFDSWFNNSKDFERLKKTKFLNCINCNSKNLEKSIMSPNLTGTKKSIILNSSNQKKIRKKILAYQKFIKKNCEYVGENFASEARTIHYENKKSKPIYGKANKNEIKELEEEGIETSTIPWFDNKEN